MSWLSSLFGGGKNAADAAMPYLNQIPGKANAYLQPYYQAGQRALPVLEAQYNELLHNPGQKYNQIGEQFQQSPGFKFALQQALQGAGHAAAAGGMAGSPEHEFQNMGIATNLGNQDYYNWLNGATGMYNQGLSGTQGLAGAGMQSGTNIANTIAQTLAQQANLAYQGQQQRNANQSGLIGGLLRGAGSALGAFNPFGTFG